MQSRTAQRLTGERTMVAVLILGTLVVGLFIALAALSIGNRPANGTAMPVVDAPQAINLPADRIALSIGGNATSTKSITLPADRMRLSVPDASSAASTPYNVPEDRQRLLFGE